MRGKLEGLEAVHQGGKCLAFIGYDHVWVQVLSNILKSLYPSIFIL